MHATDVVSLGVLWQRLTGLMDEVAQAFVRTSFSAVVRENWDLAVSLMDARTRQFAQSSRSIPSFLGTMPRTLRAMLDRIPAHTLQPGDVLISNDPWLGTGHLNDITLARPIFRAGRLIAFVGGTFHCVDVGGAPRPDARDVHEEGLTIPVCRIVKAGDEDPEIVAFLCENFREPDEALGDIRAMFAAFAVAERRLLGILDQEGVADLDPIVEAILARSEASMRAALAAAPDGAVEDETVADGFDAPLPIRCRIEKRGDAIALDFAGTASQVPHPVNSPFGFSSAYAAYAAAIGGATRADASVLRRGALGEAVRALQTALTAQGHALSPDGIFGPATERAVRAFQARNGLAVDGIAGPATIAALGGARRENAVLTWLRALFARLLPRAGGA